MNTHASTNRRGYPGSAPGTWAVVTLAVMAMALLLPASARADVEFYPGAYASSSAVSATSVSISTTFPSLSQCQYPAIVVRVAIWNTSAAQAPVVDSVTWTVSTGQSLAYNTGNWNGEGDHQRERTEIWFLTGPTAGNGTALVSLSGAADVAADVVAACGVNQTSPAAGSGTTFTGTPGTDVTAYAPSTQGALVLDVLAIESGITATTTSPSRAPDMNPVNVASHLNAYSSHYIDTTTGGAALPHWSLDAADYWVDSVVVLQPVVPCPPGTATLGYWKTHPEAWPVDEIAVGGVTYSKADAIDIMSTPSRGDKTYDLFKQLVSAMLNVAAGNDPSCISSDITAADEWLLAHPLGSKVKGKDWNLISATHDRLDDYNNGWLCAPYRGTVQCGGSS
jgi:hypothetical protein